jgi:hypothetical protein
MFLGRAPNHADDTYRFLNLATKHVIVSRDVLWHGNCYGDWKGITTNTFTVIPAADDSDNDDDDLAPDTGRAEGAEVADWGNGDIISLQDDDEERDDEDDDLLNNDEDLPNNLPTVTNNIPSVNHPKVIREMKRLSEFFNPAASAYGRIDRRAASTEVVPDQPDVVPTTEVNDMAR